jgi:excisionase family DNA binding protein
MEGPIPMSDLLLTVEQCADRLKLHPKTVLRFIHEGRLKAVKVGRGYRIAAAEVGKILGEAAAPAIPVRAPRATTIVDAEGVSSELAQKIARVLPAVRMGREAQGGVLPAVRMGREAQGEPMNIDVVHDPARAQLKIVLTGSPADAAALLGLIAELLKG